MIRYVDGEPVIEEMSSEELERFVERRLEDIVHLWINGQTSKILWHCERALEACNLWRHVGSQTELFDARSVAHVSSHAVDPLER